MTKDVVLGMAMSCTIYKKCDNPECENIYEYEDTLFLEIFYNKFSLKHQNPESPLVQDKDPLTKIEIRLFCNLSLNYITNLYWQIVKYKDNKGMLSLFNKDKDKFSYGLFLKEVETTPLFNYILEINGSYYKLFHVFKNNIEFQYHEKYTRKKIEIIDVIANICSLSSTIFSIFTFVFRHIYSYNFDSYKIIDNIISKEFNQEIKIN